MQLLVSVSSPIEARRAVEGGADIVDAKDPTRGALGAVDAAVLDAICAAVGRRRPVSAALGDLQPRAAGVVDSVPGGWHVSSADAPASLAFVKVAVGDLADGRQATAALRALVTRTAGSVVAVAYADQGPAALTPFDVAEAAERAGCVGVLLDTRDKEGPGLTTLMPASELTRWVRQLHLAGLRAAVAGRLSIEDLPVVAGAGADIAGVRGAACDGGRSGMISVDRVRALVARARLFSLPAEISCHVRHTEAPRY